MSEISDAIQDKCLLFGDRIIKLNDYLLKEAACRTCDVRGRTSDVSKGKTAFGHQPSDFRRQTSRVPVYLQSISTLCNQLLRAGTSIGANNAEACNAISKADFKSKSFIALKEARESLYWLELLHRNNYLTDEQYNSINADCEELVKILVHRLKKINEITTEEQEK